MFRERGKPPPESGRHEAFGDGRGSGPGQMPPVGQLHQWVRSAALRQPGAAQVQPFGPNFEVFKVAGKVFAMTTNAPGREIATIKSEPENGLALRQQHDFISAGYHMNKRHWLSISDEPSVTQELIEELVANSYLLVVDGLTKTQRAELPRGA